MNTSALIGSLVGSGLGTLLFCKIAFWLTKSWPDAISKFVVIYGGLSFVLVLADAYTRAENGSVNVSWSAAMILPFTALLFVLDAVSWRTRAKAITH